ncbi:MAG: toll/interleukin-1 receptor domain-containing protein [Chloroflexota bacterium]
MNHIFISYSRQDIDFARYTRALLENLGFYVWMDEKRLTVGMDWWDEIEQSIDTCGAFIIIMSPDSRESVFCRNEILRALDQKKPLFPVLYRGRHFGMIAHAQHEDMRAGLNATFSDDFVSRLSHTVGQTTTRTIDFTVIHSPIEAVEADVFLHKQASGSGGLDRRLMGQLQKRGVEFDKNTLQDIGDYIILDSHNTITTPKIAFIKTHWVGALGYRQVRQFAERGLAVLGLEMPHAKHIIMTLHGVNTRLHLDEGESLLAQLAGLIDVLQAWQAPHGLEKISIVEHNEDRVQRVKARLGEYFEEVDFAQSTPDTEWGYTLTFKRDNQINTPEAGASEIKPYAIALFPEDPNLEDIFYYGIERPVHAMGLLCERLNLSSDDDSQDLSTLLERIKHATTVICDVTHMTPELYLQLGYAWGADIPTAIITRNDDPQPELGEVVQYQKIWQLEERLSKWIKATLT